MSFKVIVAFSSITCQRQCAGLILMMCTLIVVSTQTDIPATPLTPPPQQQQHQAKKYNKFKEQFVELRWKWWNYKTTQKRALAKKKKLSQSLRNCMWFFFIITFINVQGFLCFHVFDFHKEISINNANAFA